MKKVININFQGRVVPIEETSYEMLKQYVDSLRNYFAKEEGKDEIINDIESRIAELFNEKLKAGAFCITDEDVSQILNNMGRPQDFAEVDEEGDARSGPAYESEAEPNYQSANRRTKTLYRDEDNRIAGGVCSGLAAYFNIEPVIVRLIFVVFAAASFIPYIVLWAFLPKSSNLINGVRKRLYRNPDDKMIAGVCSGLASYFNINVWIPRALFLLPFISILLRNGIFDLPNFVSFTFSPGSMLVYIILWLTIPEANTTAEKLEMKGEKVDLNSIKNSVVEEMKGVQERMRKVGKEAKDVIVEKTGKAGPEITQAVKRSSAGIGGVILFLVKAFAYFIVSIVALALVIGLFSIAVASIGIFPVLKAYILNGNWQIMSAWGTLIFFIGVPVIGIITWIIRRVARARRGSTFMRYSFIALWVIGWFFLITLLASVSQDFKSRSRANVDVVELSNPSVNSLELLPFPNAKYAHNLNFRFEPFAGLDEDTMILNNVKYHIVRSTSDSFEITIARMSRGRSMSEASQRADAIQFSMMQQDSFVYADRGIAITPASKFRNQYVDITIAVPVGKTIRLSKALGQYNWVHVGGPWEGSEWENREWDSEERGWEFGATYVMRSDGLYTVDGFKTGEANDRYRYKRRNASHGYTDDNNDDESGLNIRGSGMEQTNQKIDSLKRIREIQLSKAKDSLRKAQEEINRTLQKLEEQTIREEAITYPNLNIYSGLLES